MICPRCGIVATATSPACARCGGSLARPEVSRPEPPVPRAPTHRGEMAQRAAGIEPQVLAKPTAKARVVPEVPRFTAPPVGAPPPAAPEGTTWPPPPATWEPAPAGAAPSSPPPAWAPPDPSWGPPNSWAPPAHPPAQSHTWARPQHESGPSRAWLPTPVRRWANPFSRPQAGTDRATVPTYFWQALACLILFPPTGVAAVVYSLMVTKRTQTGDAAGADRASYLARIWCLWSMVGLALLLVVGAVTGLKP